MTALIFILYMGLICYTTYRAGILTNRMVAPWSIVTVVLWAIFVLVVLTGRYEG